MRSKFEKCTKLMILIFLLLLSIIYVQNGLLHAIPFILGLIVFIISNFLIIVNPTIKLQIIRLWSIAIILIIIYLNSTTLLTNLNL